VPSIYLSLRWKALIVLSIVLALVNASLAFLAYRQAAEQFERQQMAVRDRQIRQLQALLDDGYRQMARLANIVPLLGSDQSDQTINERLHHALDHHGFMLDLEWDIRSVHWIQPNDQAVLLWPNQAQALPAELITRLQGSPEQTATLLTCAPDCYQYLAAPLLWQGRSTGALALGRSVADALLTFHALTGAEVAIWVEQAPMPFPVITHPEQVESLLRDADLAQLDVPGNANTLLIKRGGNWFEIFRLLDLMPEVDVLLINTVTAQRQAIAKVTRNSILIGILGLVLSEGLLLLMMQTLVRRLRRLAGLLPLLADDQFAELRDRLPTLNGQLPLRDEMDLMIDAVDALSERMEHIQHDREAARSELVWLADHDPLTRLLNRRRFNQDLTKLIDEAVREGYSGALLFIDLDQFKDVNDISGHPVGDILLQRVAEQLEMLIGAEGVLGRFGGDEFALALPQANSKQAIAIAEQVQTRICAVIVRNHGLRHQVSASIGIVLFPEHGVETQQLLADADLAMYQAKERGRGRWYLFSPADQGRELANARVLWSERITEALIEDRFELHFQPIMELATGSVQRKEALLRMRDAQGELVYPNHFIPVAEKTGQIHAIDHWVLARSILILQIHPDLQLSVNLSANAMDDPSLLSELKGLLAQYHVDPARLTFEITETVAVDSLQNTQQMMRGIQELSCRFALDDFGSGFASYAYLRQLPVDAVKIDGAFIRNIAHNREDQIFVRAVTDIAHGMGKRVVAEFVENEEILNILRQIGVDYAQGYHIGRPGALLSEKLPPSAQRN